MIYGKIRVSDMFVKENIKDMLPLFTRFVPVHVEIRPYHRDYIYTGFSEDFDDLPEAVEMLIAQRAAA